MKRIFIHLLAAAVGLSASSLGLAADPTQAASWHGHDLLGVDVNHGHSLQTADIDGDGNLDIFCAELPAHPHAVRGACEPCRNKPPHARQTTSRRTVLPSPTP